MSGDWRDEAACKGHPPAMWFPERGDTATMEMAVAICGICPVREACLEHALVNGETEGVWGGQPARARRRVASERRKAGTLPKKPPRTASLVHGTDAGYYAELRSGTRACSECAAAHATAAAERAERRRQHDQRRGAA